MTFKKGQAPLNKGRGKAAQLIEQHVGHRDDACLIWPMATDDKGYGFLGYQGGMIKAHRLMLILSKGQPPTPKHQAAHSCGNRACFNPRHLSWKTNSENQRDRRDHGTHGGALGRGRRHLSPQQILFVQESRGRVTVDKLAEMHGVKRGCIQYWQRKARLAPAFT